MDDSQLADRHVAIVGGSSGIGRAIAFRAKQAGARVTLLARDAEKLRRTAAELGGAATRTLDLRREETIVPALEGLGAIDHLAITAGSYGLSPIAESEPDDWRGVLEERLIGPLCLIKQIGPGVRSSIVWYTGTIAHRPIAGSAIVSAALAGVEAAAKALARELAPIRVNLVIPGMIDTPLLDNVLGEAKAEQMAAAAKRLPAGLVGSAEEAADAAIYFMCNRYSTGASLLIDGGNLLL